METPFAHIPHPLRRDGTSQLDRQNGALTPAFASIDGRDTGDLLKFLYEYARQVNFYDEDHLFRDGDWAPAFQKSVPFQYAIIGGFDLQLFERQFEEADRGVRRRLTLASLNPMFDLLFDMAAQLEQWLGNLPSDSSGLKTAVANLMESDLRNRFRKTVGLANSAGKWGYRRKKDADRLSRYWGMSVADVYRVDASILSLKGSQKYKVLEARTILEELFRTFYKGMEEIVGIANDADKLELSFTNSERQDHEPHLGLLFAFLFLFKRLQGNLNSLSESHLDFFYRKILQLKDRPVLADKAHLVFELAKKVETDVLLAKGERLKAGKDANGQEIFFQLEEDLVIDKAQVAQIKTLHIEQGKTGAFIPCHLSAVYASPVANSADGLGEGFPKDAIPSWRTVGGPMSKWTNPDTGQIAPQPFARLGFLVASKVLFLREGNRKIFLKMTLESAPPQPFTSNFDVWLSTDEGWTWLGLKPLTVNGTIVDIELVLPPEFPPVVYPGADALEADYGHEDPMIRLELNQQFNGPQADYDNPYYWLRALKIANIAIDVFVCDVRNLVVQNDLAVMDVSKPFQPFGPAPKRNSSNFLIGSEEIFCKNWQAIDVKIEWKDKPGNFPGYYFGYNNPPAQNSFVAGVDLLSGRNWIRGRENNAVKNLRLFENDGTQIASSGQTVCGPITTNTPVTYSNVQRPWFANAKPCKVAASIQNGYASDLECGFLRLKLGGQDFRHDEYGTVLTKFILALADAATLNPNASVLLGAANDKLLMLQNQKYNSLKNNLNETVNKSTSTKSKIQNLFSGPIMELGLRHIAATNDAEGARQSAEDSSENFQNLFTEVDAKLPNEPYTPLIETISLDYHAVAALSEKNLAFSHLHPWQETYESFEPGTSPTVLPCFVDEGTLYIGLENYRPGNVVSLFFQMEPSTADPDADKAVVCWEYLRNNEWKPLLPDSDVQADETRGLIQPGIVKIAIPADISHQQTTIMPPDLHWIKARVLLRTRAISETLTVHTQAARGVFAPAAESDLFRLGQPLEQGRIAKFVNPIPAIKGVSQPYPGFGGSALETPDNFYRRASERLRHKGRAISLYDYELLVLEAFPDVYKVKCISHALGRRGEDRDYELSPGFVTLVVIPDLERVNAVDIFQPRLPAATLQAIREYLEKRISPFIRLEVLNPIYEPISVMATVQFRKGRSENFNLDQLKKDVQGFLAPWSSAENRRDISFGGQISYSLILNFIENRPYVDFVLDLSLSGADGEATEAVKANTSRSVLTAAAIHTLKTPAENDLLPSAARNRRRGIGFDIISE